MEINGIDLDGLAHSTTNFVIPAVVPGRTVHVDADFLAYQCSFEHADDPKDWDDMVHNAAIAVNTIKELAGAEFVHLHLTPSTSNKGGRYDIALLKPYQANRDDKAKPRFLTIMREHLAKTFPGTLHQNCEADDGMSSAQYAAIARGEEHLSVIASKDKDLRMVPGLHLDWDTGIIHDSGSTYGYLELLRTPSGTAKLGGYGQAFFWAQLLTGDTADNISGVPKVTGKFLNIYKPTKEILIAQGIANDVNLGPTATGQRAQAKLDARKAGACGPALAFDILKDVHSNAEAFALTKDIYRSYGEEIGFVHHNMIENVPWNKAYVSESQLLWMRKTKEDAMCVARFFRDILAA